MVRNRLGCVLGRRTSVRCDGIVQHLDWAPDQVSERCEQAAMALALPYRFPTMQSCAASREQGVGQKGHGHAIRDRREASRREGAESSDRRQAGAEGRSVAIESSVRWQSVEGELLFLGWKRQAGGEARQVHVETPRLLFAHGRCKLRVPGACVAGSTERRDGRSW